MASTGPALHVVFDLDDTLFLTREAVRRAYAKAGVIMPHDMWGKPWRFWTTREIHAKKVRHYEDMVADEYLTPATPALDALRQLTHTAFPVYVLTGASKHTSLRLLSREGISRRLLSGTQFNASRHDKVVNLATLASLTANVVYVDDDETFADDCPAGVRFIHYRGQNTTTLLKDITWTPSS